MEIRSISELKKSFGINRPNFVAYANEKKEEYIEKINRRISEENADGNLKCEVLFKVTPNFSAVDNYSFFEEAKRCEKSVLEEIKTMLISNGYECSEVFIGKGYWSIFISWKF